MSHEIANETLQIPKACRLNNQILPWYRQIKQNNIYAAFNAGPYVFLGDILSTVFLNLMIIKHVTMHMILVITIITCPFA